MPARGLVMIIALALWVGAEPPAEAQIPVPGPAAADAEEASAPEKIDVEPSASDDAIARRLARIMKSTGWYENVSVRVDEGVVFLSGVAQSEVRRGWAGDLARGTEAVVAVVNRLEVPARSPWDTALLKEELGEIASGAVRALPILVFAGVILILSWFGARLVGFGVRRALRDRISTVLLLDLAARLAGFPVLLLGLYLILQVSGLTRLALTLVGGTGIIALVVGIAFRDIMENFLASVLISVRRPFSVGDVVEIQGNQGVIQKVTTRGTLLMSFDGNHVQIPNATVYKSQIVNYTANPKRRMEFAVGIGYDDPLAEAQAAALAVLKGHPSVLADPEPLVLVEALAASTVNLRFYFWYDGSEFDGRKVRSALIRAVKRSFEDAGYSMPDEAREVIFPNGVPVLSQEEAREEKNRAAERARPAGKEAAATDAEGGLDSEHAEIQAQANASRSPEEGDDLLASNESNP